MSFINPEFAKRLGPKVKAELEADPRLLKQYERQRAGRPRQSSGWSSHLLYGLFISLAVGVACIKAESLTRIMFAMTLCCAGMACLSVWRVLSTAYSQPEVYALLNLPVRAHEIFHFCSRIYLRESWWMLVYIIGIFLAASVAQSTPLWTLPVVILLAVLQLAIIVTGAFWLAEHIPSHIWRPLGWCLCFTAFVIALFLRKLDLSWESTEWFVIIVPTGWVEIALHYGLIRGELWGWSTLLPAVAFVATLPYGWARMRSYYFPDAMIYLAGEAEQVGYDEPRRRAGITEISDNVQERTFLAATDGTKRGWFERWLVHWLSPRERTIFELTAGPESYLTKTIRFGLIVAPIVWLIIWLWGHSYGWLVYASTIILGRCLIPYSAGDWRIFKNKPVGNLYTAFPGMFPVSFDEVTRLVLKAHGLQLLIVAPVIVVTVLLAGHIWDYSLASNLFFALKILFFAAAWQLVVVVLNFSQSSKHSRSRHNAGVVLGLIVATIGFAVSVFVAIVNHADISNSFLAWLLFLTCCASVFFVYRHRYLKGRVDLISDTPPEDDDD